MVGRSALTSGQPPGSVSAVPHVELSLSEPNGANTGNQLGSCLQRWASAVRAAEEYCFILDHEGIIVAISDPFESLLGPERPALGRDLLDCVRLVDFADGGPIADGEIGKIPPVLAMTTGRLARGLLRVDTADGGCTLDAVAAPLVEGDETVGSLTFFSRI